MRYSFERRSAFALRAGEEPSPAWAIFPLLSIHAALLPVPFLLAAFSMPGLPAWWHQHEGLFGMASGLLCGFLLIALPNWLGMKSAPAWFAQGLIALWFAGRLSILWGAAAGSRWPVLLDAAMPVILAFWALVAIMFSGRLRVRKIAVLVAAFAIIKAGYGLALVLGADIRPSLLAATGAIVMLVTTILGRMIPVFTQLATGASGIPRFGTVDAAAMIVSTVALGLWIVIPLSTFCAATAVTAAILQGWRLWRWQGWRVGMAPDVLILHIAYGFAPFGFAAIAGRALWPDVVGEDIAVHAFLAGLLGVAAISVVARLAMGHLLPSRVVRGFFLPLAVLVAFAALARLSVGPVPAFANIALTVSAIAWVTGFGGLGLALVHALGSRRRLGRLS